MASGLGGGAGASPGIAPASSPQATAPSGNRRGGGRQQDTFAGLLAGAVPAADTAAATTPVSAAVPASDTSPEEAVIDGALPEQILNLIGGGWPVTTPPTVADALPSGGMAGDPLTDAELPTPLLPINATTASSAGPVAGQTGGLTVPVTATTGPALPLVQAGAATTGPVAGQAGGLPFPVATTTGPALPLAQAGAIDGADAAGELALAIGQAIDADAAVKSPASAAEGADPVEFTLPGQQTMAVSPARNAAPVLTSAPVAMPADPGAGFDDSFGARIGWMAEQRIGHARIRVSPDHVGPIEVRLQLDGTRVSAEFVSANADVRQALEASVGRLRDLLDQQGLQLAHSDVGSGQSGTSGERAASDSSDAPGFADGGSISDNLPAPALMRRGLLDEYA
ncbi:MAG TPA: flagellar hook-length control protein FliK [Lysobacter sp.]|nr:flagellar hook-length control protein FliK [Lysobacter sp.]